MFLFEVLVSSLTKIKSQKGANPDFKFLKKTLQLAIKNIILLKREPELTQVEKDANNYKIRFLYEISPQSFNPYFSNLPPFNISRKKN